MFIKVLSTQKINKETYKLILLCKSSFLNISEHTYILMRTRKMARGRLHVTVTGTVNQKRLRKIYRSYAGGDSELIPQAYKMARECHKGKKRKDKETDYIKHPLKVAIRAAELRMNENGVCASLLHDAMEGKDKNHRSRAEIETVLNKRIANMVVRLTKPKWSSDDHGWVHASHPRFSEIPDGYTEDMYEIRGDVYYRQLLESGEYDAMIVKVLDNLDNLQDMEPLTDKQRKRQLLTMAKHTIILAPRLFSPAEVGRIKDEFMKWNVLLPEPVFPKVPKEPIVVLPPRKMIWAGNVDLLPEPGMYVSVYADPRWLFLTNSLELGLPYLGDEVHYSHKIQDWLEEIGSGLTVTVGRSMVPLGSKAREKIYIIKGFREEPDAYSIRSEGENAIIAIPEGRITIPMTDVSNMRFGGSRMEKAFRETVERYRGFIEKLRTDFYENHLKPIFEQH